MKIRESSTAIWNGHRFRHSKSWAILDNDGNIIKRFATKEEAKTFIINFKEAKV